MHVNIKLEHFRSIHGAVTVTEHTIELPEDTPITIMPDAIAPLQIVLTHVTELPPEPGVTLGLYRCNNCRWYFARVARGWTNAILDEDGNPFSGTVITTSVIPWIDWRQRYGDCAYNLERV